MARGQEGGRLLTGRTLLVFASGALFMYIALLPFMSMTQPATRAESVNMARDQYNALMRENNALKAAMGEGDGGGVVRKGGKDSWRLEPNRAPQKPPGPPGPPAPSSEELLASFPKGGNLPPPTPELMELLRGGVRAERPVRTPQHDQGWKSHPHLTECDPEALERLRHSDVVYTWVNGSEPEYRAERLAYKGKVGGPRDAEHDELRFSLRSLFTNLPWWDGRVFIVAPKDQRPTWLADQPRVTMVNQDDLFPVEYRHVLPSFNTNALEQHLWRIPGLTDVFIVVNDDYVFVDAIDPRDMFGQSCSGVRFFFEGGTISHNQVKEQQRPKKIWLSATINTNKALDTVFGNEPRHFLKHAPFVYYRPAFQEVTNMFKTKLEPTMRHRYRHYDDVVTPLLHHYYMKNKGAKQFDVPVEIADFQASLMFKLEQLSDKKLDNYRQFFMDVLSGELKYKILAFNDDNYKTTGKLQKVFTAFLTHLFPSKAPWEI